MFVPFLSFFVPLEFIICSSKKKGGCLRWKFYIFGEFRSCAWASRFLANGVTRNSATGRPMWHVKNEQTKIGGFSAVVSTILAE